MDPVMIMLLFFVIMLVPMWLMSRGQRKRMIEHQNLVKSLSVGDEVRTHSGFYGMIVEDFGETVILETEDGSQLKWNRNAIAERVTSYGDAAEGDEGAEQGTESSTDTHSDFLSGKRD